MHEKGKILLGVMKRKKFCADQRKTIHYSRFDKLFELECDASIVGYAQFSPKKVDLLLFIVRNLMRLDKSGLLMS